MNVRQSDVHFDPTVTWAFSQQQAAPGLRALHPRRSFVIANALSVGGRHVKEIVPQCRQFLPTLYVGWLECHGEYPGVLVRTFV